ncbi:UNVERIFIED_CONTAM: Vestitone reductase [Sesamum indicum]
MEEKGRVCVTGGSGFVASWLIMRLLQHGYSANTTVRTQSHSSGSKRDISFLTNLPGASERLQVFSADFENPDSFEAAIEGCTGVFHVAHPFDFEGKDAEEMITSLSVRATLGILDACLKVKTVRRVVYTSSIWTVMFNDEGRVVDEGSWSDVDYTRNLKFFGDADAISKTITERAALEFAEKHSLDLVSVLPTWIHGPFICPNCPLSVYSALAMIIRNMDQIFQYFPNMPFVHIDDVANAHIFLFEYPKAKGSCLTNRAIKVASYSSKKLLNAGFKYKLGWRRCLMKPFNVANRGVCSDNVVF